MISRIIVSLVILINTFGALAYDFSGAYKCDKAFDSQDGNFTSTITLRPNNDYKKANSSYSIYNFEMKCPGYNYTWEGTAIANGNNLAIYFYSVGEHREKSDFGTASATIITHEDKKGKITTSLHEFYYETAYKGKPAFGFQDCKKLLK
ncbi:MAG: hypothetical protein SFT93_04335 [Rickettsiaceae bacterium]|nr:hypothetical protein [Rickettsiaceae bacterium]